MSRKSYPSDLTDEQWEILGPLLPPAKPGGRPRTVDLREVVNGILYLLRSMPLVPQASLAEYFRSWTMGGTWASETTPLVRDEGKSYSQRSDHR